MSAFSSRLTVTWCVCRDYSSYCFCSSSSFLWGGGVTYAGCLRQLPPDVDELVLQSFLLEPEFLQSQRLSVEQLHLLVSGHQRVLQVVLGKGGG